MIPLSPLETPNKHGALSAAIEQYNQLLQTSADDMNIEKLFLLQKINHIVVNSSPDAVLSDWYDLHDESSFESHLQRYGIQRDGSTLVKDIQFATAVCHFSPSQSTLDSDYFSALRQRNELFSTAPSQETMSLYLRTNQRIMDTFNQDPNLLNKYLRSRHFLSLCYAKMEAIKGVVDQSLDDYKTNPLNSGGGNNKNFTMEISGETKQLVIRVEDRQSLANEHILQTYPVSEYFSEDYYTIMLPFKADFRTEYRPVVLTEFVEGGALDDYAETLDEKYSKNDILLETQRIFTLMNDFCLKLIDAQHYHPDIKLSNFLTDGESIIISDRKTIINEPRPKADKVLTTVGYAPPEFLACLNQQGTAISPFKARNTTFDMPSFMSYQMGLALKEFLCTALKVKGITFEDFQQWKPLESLIAHTNSTQRNLSVLMQELTRSEALDRLSIQDFNTLLPKIHLSHQQFIQELEQLSPQSRLSHAKDLDQMASILNAQQWTPELEALWDELDSKNTANELYGDPRLHFIDIAHKEIRGYLHKIHGLISESDARNASPVMHLGSYLGMNIANTTKVEDLPALPMMPKKIERYYKIIKTMYPNTLSQSNSNILEHVLTRQSRSFSPATITDGESESNTSSPVTDREDSTTQEDVMFEFDASSMIRVPQSSMIRVPQSSMIRVPPSSEDVMFEFDSSSMIRVPQSSMVRVPLSSMVRVPQSSMVKKHEETATPRNAHKRALERIKADLNSDAPTLDEESSPSHATDIESTIKRGSGKFKF